MGLETAEEGQGAAGGVVDTGTTRGLQIVQHHRDNGALGRETQRKERQQNGTATMVGPSVAIVDRNKGMVAGRRECNAPFPWGLYGGGGFINPNPAPLCQALPNGWVCGPCDPTVCTAPFPIGG